MWESFVQWYTTTTRPESGFGMTPPANPSLSPCLGRTHADKKKLDSMSTLLQGEKILLPTPHFGSEFTQLRNALFTPPPKWIDNGAFTPPRPEAKKNKKSRTEIPLNESSILTRLFFDFFLIVNTSCQIPVLENYKESAPLINFWAVGRSLFRLNYRCPNNRFIRSIFFPTDSGLNSSRGKIFFFFGNLSLPLAGGDFIKVFRFFSCNSCFSRTLPLNIGSKLPADFRPEWDGGEKRLFFNGLATLEPAYSVLAIMNQ